MKSNTILTLSDELLERYRSSIPRKAFEQFVEDITTGPAATVAPKFDTSLLCRASFPAALEDDGGRCIVEVTVYRLNAVAVHTFLLDGPPAPAGPRPARLLTTSATAKNNAARASFGREWSQSNS